MIKIVTSITFLAYVLSARLKIIIIILILIVIIRQKITIIIILITFLASAQTVK